MRDIKFRAWDKKRKIILQVGSIDWTKRHRIEEVWCAGDKSSLLGEDIELMQYTGLKDMNGKEIYEGDILAGEYISFKVQVIYYDGTYETVSSVGHYRSLSEFSGCAVVGNIYENPELLEGK